MWEFEFEAPVGGRTLRRWFFGVTLCFMQKDTNQDDWWWSDGHNKFVPYEEMIAADKGGSSHMHGIRSFKAFKRFLRKNEYLKEYAGEIVLVSRVGSNITAKWRPTV